MNSLRELYAYREMIFSLVRRDLQGRYKGSVLGFFWTFLSPLLQLCVYTIVFSMIMRNGIKDFYLFLFVALVPWIFFSSSVSGGASCIWSAQDMVKKIYFPREVLPLAFVLSQFINMLLSLLVVFAVLLISGKGFELIALLCLPVIMIVEFMLALGMAMIASSVSVYVRDLQYLLGIVMMAWQFMTPVMYDIEMVPERLLTIFYINPMTPIIIAYRQILYYKVIPDFRTLIWAAGIGVLFLFAGFIIFKKLKRRFAEQL